MPGPLNKPLSLTGTCLFALLSIGRCLAADSSFGGSLVATTDYVHRGLSQTGGQAALQGDLHYRAEAGWFAGIWASSLASDDKYLGSVEMNGYAGWGWAPSPDWSTRISYVRYAYPDSTASANYDYGELTGTVTYQDRVFATIGWSPDVVRATRYGLGRRGNGYSYELSARQPIWRWFAVAAGVGYYDLTDVIDDSYSAWNAAFTASFGSVEIDLARFDTDATARDLFGPDRAGDRWALTAIWRF